MSLFSKKQNSSFTVTPWRGILPPGKENEMMKITLGNGLVLEGTQSDVLDAMRKLGYGDRDDKFYNSSTKGLILISEMETSHLRNAVLKMHRDWAESLSQIQDPQDVVNAIELGNSNETFIAMMEELDDRESF